MTTASAVSVTCTEDLAADTRGAIIAVCIAAHAVEDYKNLFTYVPAGGLHFLAWDGAQLVSHAMVTTRWLQVAGGPLLKTAYVDAVSTVPTRQGQGYGSAVMRALAAGIEADFEVAGLETDRPSFYTRLGWELWRGPLAGRSDTGLVPTPQQAGVMVLRLPQSPPLDFERRLTIECQPARIW